MKEIGGVEQMNVNEMKKCEIYKNCNMASHKSGKQRVGEV